MVTIIFLCIIGYFLGAVITMKILHSLELDNDGIILFSIIWPAILPLLILYFIFIGIILSLIWSLEFIYNFIFNDKIDILKDWKAL